MTKKKIYNNQKKYNINNSDNFKKSKENNCKVEKIKDDIIFDDNLDTTFVDKKFKTKIKQFQPVENMKKHSFMYFVFVILFILLLVFSSFSVYIFITYKPKVITKTVEKIVMDENIVFLGDSITHGYNLEKYFPNNSVVNSGIDGNNTQDILDNLKERVYRYNPSKVFLLIGTNDILYKDKEEIIDNIKKIIDNIKKERPNCKIYLESIYPINDTDDEKIDHDMVGTRENDDIKKINKELELYASKNNIPYINMYDQLIDEDGNLNLEYTREGLHLSDKGYEVVTDNLKKYLKALNSK